MRLAVKALTLALMLHICLCLCGGCASRQRTQDLTIAQAGAVVLSRQSSPTEIQSSVMVFADKYISRAADVYDQVHDAATTPQERLYARRAKVGTALGATTTAAEVNPVAAMLDMVTMVRIKRRSFQDHGALALPPEPAQLIQRMHEQSEQDVWELAGRFLNEEEVRQLRQVIDEWYDNNPEVRRASHVKLIDFASFRRESPADFRRAHRNVLSILQVDPLAGMDPVARQLHETRGLAERAMFFGKRTPALAFWMFQLAKADMLDTPELTDLLDRTETVAASTERFVTSTEQFTDACESFAETWKGLPKELDQIVTAAIADLHKAVAAEREAAIEQSNAAITAQREALLHDVNAVEGNIRGVIDDVNKTLAQSESTASAISATAQDAVKSAHLNINDVVDHAYWRVLTLVALLLIGIPAMLILYRLATTRLFGPRGRPAPDSTVHAIDRSHVHE